MIRLKFIYYCQLTGFFSFHKVAQIPRLASLIFPMYEMSECAVRKSRIVKYSVFSVEIMVGGGWTKFFLIILLNFPPAHP